MNRSLTILLVGTQASLLMGSLAVTCPGQTAPATESASVVKITDIKKQSEYQVFTQSELIDVRKQNDIEQRLFPQALSAAAQDWKADKQNEHMSFPDSKFAAPRVEITEQCTSREQAEKKLAAYQDRDAKREKDKAKQEKNAKPDKTKLEKEAALDRAYQILQSKLSDLVTKEREKTAAKDAPKPQAPAEKTE